MARAPTMIHPMKYSPWPETPLWKTIRVIADAAMDPMYPNVRSRPGAAVLQASLATAAYRLGHVK